MALHHELSIHKTGSQLLGLAAVIHAQMKRGYKRTVGDKIVAHCAEMLDLMALSNATRGEERIGFLREVLKHNRAAVVWLRIAFDAREVSQGRWAESVHLLDSVGKQASGWIKKTREKAPAA